MPANLPQIRLGRFSLVASIAATLTACRPDVPAVNEYQQISQSDSTILINNFNSFDTISGFEKFTNIQFRGKVHLTVLDTSFVRLSQSKFDSLADFELHAPLQIQSSIFKNNVYFHTSKDPSRISHHRILKLEEEKSFKMAVSEDTLALENFTLDVNNSEFYSQVGVTTLLDRPLRFNYCTFTGTVGVKGLGNIWGTRRDFALKSPLFFNQCSFTKSLILSPTAYYDSTFSLNYSQILGDTLSLAGLFKYPPKLYKTSVPPIVILSINNIFGNWKSKIDLSGCVLRSDLTQKSRLIISHREFDYDLIASSEVFAIDFDDDIPLNLKLNILKKMIDNCKERLMTESVESWTIEYNKYFNILNYGIFGKILNFFQKYWWNYGFSSWMVVIVWTPGLFMFFWIINFLCVKQIVRRVYNDKDLGGNFLRNGEPLRLDNFWRKMSYSFFLTLVLFFGFKVKHEAVNHQNGLGMAYIYLMYLTGLFHVAYCASLLLR